MNNLTKYISSQFKNPKGFGGILIGIVQNIVNREMYKQTVKLVDIKANDKLLDIGYGNGHLLEMIYKKRKVDLYGIDISDDAKEMAIKRNKKANQSHQLHLAVGDCCQLPYPDDMFDVITSINTIYFWTDTQMGLNQIKRVLKQGASFYNVVYTKEYLDTVKYTKIGYKKFLINELIELGNQAGFKQVTAKEIVKDKSYVVIYTK